MTRFLLPERNGNSQGLRHLLCGIEIVEWAGLFKEDRVDVLQHASHFDGLRWVVRTVGVGVDGNLVAKFLACQRDQRLGASRHSVLIAAHPSADTVFYGFSAGLFDQMLEIRDLLLWSRVAASAGDVERNLVPDHTTEQVAN